MSERRDRPNPYTFTPKGERMYQHIVESYGASPRAREIAARTVYARHRDVPGLVRNDPDEAAAQFFEEGVRDCHSAFDANDFAWQSDGDALDVANATLDRYELEGLRRDWLFEHDDVPDAAAQYVNWRRGWAQCAASKIEAQRALQGNLP